MRRVLTVLGAVLLIATLGFALALYRDASLQRGRILPGVSINGIPVGGLTPAAAKVRIEAVVAERLVQTLGIRAGGQIWRPTLADLGVHADLDDAVAEAFALGREANPFRRLVTRWRLRAGINVSLRFSRRDDEAIHREARVHAGAKDDAPGGASARVKVARKIGVPEPRKRELLAGRDHVEAVPQRLLDRRRDVRKA